MSFGYVRGQFLIGLSWYRYRYSQGFDVTLYLGPFFLMYG